MLRYAPGARGPSGYRLRCLIALTSLVSWQLVGCFAVPLESLSPTGTSEPDLTSNPSPSMFPAGDTANPPFADEGEVELGFTAQPVFCCNPLSIQFEVSPAIVETMRLPTFTWEFGDGRNGSGAWVEHTYAMPGEFAVRLTAQEVDGPNHGAERVLSLVGNADGGIDVTLYPAELEEVGEGSSDPSGPQSGVSTTLAVEAGGDQFVFGGTTVRLSARVTVSPPHSRVTLRWRQVAGPIVAIVNPTYTTAIATTPPAAGGPATLSFEVAASVGNIRASDTTTVTVHPRPPGPAITEISGPRVEFLLLPPVSAAPGVYPVSWRFRGEVAPTQVAILQDCCRCPDTIVPAFGPDATGVYRAAISISNPTTIWIQVSYVLAGVVFRSQSVYVNPPGPSTSVIPAPVIWYHHRRIDPLVLASAARSGLVTHVLINGADREVEPHNSQEILDAMAIARHAGLAVIWTRYLWHHHDQLQSIEDAFLATTYADAVAQVRAEAAALGADYTALDCEAYSGSPLDAFLDADLTDEQLQGMRAAISQAASIGMVDFVFPAGTHGRPRTAQHLFKLLGGTGVAESTYFDLPSKNCRISYPYEIFGAFVAPHVERPLAGSAPFFLPNDILAKRFLWSAADGAPPGVNGLMLYPGIDDEATVAATANMLAGALAGP